ncbi:MAG: histidinol-phosphate transaminase [Woeseia sp.]
MGIESLVRPEILNLKRYVTARQESATVRMNANELPWPSQSDSATVPLMPLNRYPEIRPQQLQEVLADYYGVPLKCLLATRGSSEAIDLLIRAFCQAGRDSIVVTPPTFSMYRVYADIQGAETLSAPMLPCNNFQLDVDALLATCKPGTKIIFICSPNNPTGHVTPAAQILEIARARREKSIVVVDEAYAEFSEAVSLCSSLEGFDNIVVLRTLSKALALAGARCGAVVGAAPLIGWLDAMLAPYALATPVIDSVLRAFTVENLRTSRDALAHIVRERERLRKALSSQSQVEHIWPSQTNFLLVRFRNLGRVVDQLRLQRILVRDFPHDTQLAECARITVGTPEENDLLIAALRDGGEVS